MVLRPASEIRMSSGPWTYLLRICILIRCPGDPYACSSGVVVKTEEGFETEWLELKFSSATHLLDDLAQGMSYFLCREELP